VARSAVESAWVQRMLDVIAARSADPLSLRTFAAEIGRSEEYLARLFRQQMGTTVREYIARVRLDRAAHAIRRGDKIEAVALEIGYRSKKNFYRRFRQQFGITPGAFRKRSSGRTSPHTPRRERSQRD
jgi:AraC-like DNA-binding protein